MNKTMPSKNALATAVSLLMLGLGPTGARADTSSATIFGLLDVNLRSVHNGSAGTVKSESTDGLNSSRLGVRGLEDLGDGLQASFWLESGVAADTGAVNAKFWNRRSTVGLIDPHLGEMRLGRDTSTIYNSLITYDPFGLNGLGTPLGTTTGTGVISALGSGASTVARVDNQVSYFLPKQLGGVYGQVAVAPGEQVDGNKLFSGRLGYAGNGLDASLSYSETTVVAGDKFKIGVLGGSYDFGVIKPMVQFVQSKYASTAGGARQQNVYEVGAVIPVGLQEVHVGYSHGSMSGGAPLSGFADGDNASQFGATYVYKLSKATALYATAARLNNKNASKLSLTGGASGIKSAETSSGYEAGMRVMF